MGFRQPVRRSTLVGCQRKARLAYPCGVGPASSSPRRGRCTSTEELGLDLTNTVYALDVDDHRSVPVGLSVGALPHHQGGGEDAHAARPAGQHSEFYPHLGWQSARRSCPRYALAGSRSHLRRGSWLRRLCPPLCVAPSRGLLRHASASRTPSPARRWSSSPTTSDASAHGHHLRAPKAAGRWNSSSSGSSSIFGSSSSTARRRTR